MARQRRQRKMFEQYLCSAVIEKIGKGEWKGTVLNLDGKTATGNTREDAIKNLMAEAQAYCNELADEGVLPPKTHPMRPPNDYGDHNRFGFYVSVDRDRTTAAALAKAASE